MESDTLTNFDPEKQSGVSSDNIEPMDDMEQTNNVAEDSLEEENVDPVDPPSVYSGTPENSVQVNETQSNNNYNNNILQLQGKVHMLLFVNHLRHQWTIISCFSDVDLQFQRLTSEITRMLSRCFQEQTDLLHSILEEVRSLGSSNSTIDEIIQRHKNDYEATVRALNLPIESVERLEKLDEDLNPLRVSVECVIILISHQYSTVIFHMFCTFFQVCWLASMTRGLTSVDEVANCIHSQIMIDKLSEDHQWRSGGRQNDDRPGMSKFFNVLAVYGGKYLGI